MIWDSPFLKYSTFTKELKSWSIKPNNSQFQKRENSEMLVLARIFTRKTTMTDVAKSWVPVLPPLHKRAHQLNENPISKFSAASPPMPALSTTDWPPPELHRRRPSTTIETHFFVGFVSLSPQLAFLVVTSFDGSHLSSLRRCLSLLLPFSLTYPRFSDLQIPFSPFLIPQSRRTIPSQPSPFHPVPVVANHLQCRPHHRGSSSDLFHLPTFFIRSHQRSASSGALRDLLSFPPSLKLCFITKVSSDFRSVCWFWVLIGSCC